MSLQSDALLAVTGLFPKQISPKEHMASQAIPASFSRRLTRWVTAEEKAPFAYVPPPKDMDKKFAQLAAPPLQHDVAQWFDGMGVDDPEFAGDYFAAFTRAREYLVNAWPKFSIDSPTGPHILPLSPDDAHEVWSLMQVLDDPTRILDEIESCMLTQTQADAFRVAYPDLYEFANAAIGDELINRRAKNDDFTLGAEKEAVLNVFRGLPPEEPYVPPPPAPKDEAKDFKVDADRERTQAQVSSAPKGGK